LLDDDDDDDDEGINEEEEEREEEDVLNIGGQCKFELSVASLCADEGPIQAE
tara:strand:- start:226 stop:381 length:156 start_codon:yes stop_codon:yes gene_type:complete